MYIQTDMAKRPHPSGNSRCFRDEASDEIGGAAQERRRHESMASRCSFAATKNRSISLPTKQQFDGVAGVGKKPSLVRSASYVLYAVARCRPHSAACVHREPVRVAVVRLEEEAPVRQRAVHADVEGDDLVRVLPVAANDFAERPCRVGHVEAPPIGGEGPPVRLLEVRHAPQVAGSGIETVHAAVIEIRLDPASPGSASGTRRSGRRTRLCHRPLR